MFGYVFIISLSFIRRSEFFTFFIDNFRDQVKQFRSTVAELIVSCLYDNKDLCFPSPCIVRIHCGQSEIKRVLAPKLLSPCYKRIGSCF